mmetsp:Transcript_87229/g.249917  ORF Transcript_87229/g.249917 Transcript_87229/m.249917 type:complete len:216 (-) Transcript_87229:82-729(-)
MTLCTSLNIVLFTSSCEGQVSESHFSVLLLPLFSKVCAKVSCCGTPRLGPDCLQLEFAESDTVGRRRCLGLHTSGTTSGKCAGTAASSSPEFLSFNGEPVHRLGRHSLEAAMFSFVRLRFTAAAAARPGWLGRLRLRGRPSSASSCSGAAGAAAPTTALSCGEGGSPWMLLEAVVLNFSASWSAACGAGQKLLIGNCFDEADPNSSDNRFERGPW